MSLLYHDCQQIVCRQATRIVRLIIATVRNAGKVVGNLCPVYLLPLAMQCLKIPYEFEAENSLYPMHILKWYYEQKLA